MSLKSQNVQKVLEDAFKKWKFKHRHSHENWASTEEGRVIRLKAPEQIDL